MKKSKAWVAIAALAATLQGCSKEEPAPDAPVAAASTENIELTPRFRAGESMVFLHTEISQQGQASALHAVTREIRESRRFRLDILDAELGGVATLLFTMERVTSTVTDNGVVVFTFDSDVPSDDASGPARARGVLAGLVAKLTVAPGGTVLGMSANLTVEDITALPTNQRPLFAENWFRSVIESLYRPFGERSVFPSGETWQSTGEPGPPFLGDEHVMVRRSRVVESDGERIVIETNSVLHTAGVPAPESYSGVTMYQWSVRDGFVDAFQQRQVVRISRPIAGTAGSDRAVREISLDRINPAGRVDDKEER